MEMQKLNLFVGYNKSDITYGWDGMIPRGLYFAQIWPRPQGPKQDQCFLKFRGLASLKILHICTLRYVGGRQDKEMRGLCPVNYRVIDSNKKNNFRFEAIKTNDSKSSLFYLFFFDYFVQYFEKLSLLCSPD